jgi:hypothetical protein
MDWNEKMKQLQAPFPTGDLEWRISQSGKRDGKVWAKCLVYITNRAIMQRLDRLFPGRWKNEFKGWKTITKPKKDGTMKTISSQICGISIFDDDLKEWITRWDGAEDTDFESIKGGLSDSMKRSAVQWGIGRYLYNADEHWAITTNGNGEPLKRGNFTRVKTGKKLANGKDEYEIYYWKPPPLVVDCKNKE